MEKLTFKNEKNDKLANILCEKGFSYNYACRLLRNKDVKVNGIRTKDNILVEIGSEIEVFYEKNAQKSFFDIVFQDENVYVLNKKAGIEVEGENGLEGLLGDAIAVHRLDRNTEGLMIMAKNKVAQQQLLAAFKKRTITKKYLAEVVGESHLNGIFIAYLTKDSQKSVVKVQKNALKNAKIIKTGIKTLKSNKESSVVECELLTGKTHQIRAHLAYLGHPIIGDGKYGKNEDNKKFKKKTQQLFCYKLILNGLDGEMAYLNKKEFCIMPEWAKYLKI